MPSKTTTILPVRVENELVARLDALKALVKDSSRTALARDALRRGVELMEKESGGRSASAGKRGPSPAPAKARKGPQPGRDLAQFAADVLAAARQSRSGWSGEDRIFIGAAWRQYKRLHPVRAPSLSVFKALLLEANRQRLLSLACADMAPIHRPSVVKESEIQHLSATFHFLCVAPVSRPS